MKDGSRAAAARPIASAGSEGAAKLFSTNRGPRGGSRRAPWTGVRAARATTGGAGDGAEEVLPSPRIGLTAPRPSPADVSRCARCTLAVLRHQVDGLSHPPAAGRRFSSQRRAWYVCPLRIFSSIQASKSSPYVSCCCNEASVAGRLPRSISCTAGAREPAARLPPRQARCAAGKRRPVRSHRRRVRPAVSSKGHALGSAGARSRARMLRR